MMNLEGIGQWIITEKHNLVAEQEEEYGHIGIMSHIHAWIKC